MILHKPFRLGLTVKLIILSTTSILLTAIFLNFYFIQSKTKDYRNYLIQKGTSITTTLAYNSEYGVLSRNQEVLDKLIDGVIQERDVVYCIIYDKKDYIAQSIQARHVPISQLQLEKILTLSLQQPVLVQEYHPTNYEYSIYDFATVVTTKRLAPSQGNVELFPGYIGIIEQIKRRLHIEGQVFEEKIGTVRIGLSSTALHQSLQKMRKTLWTITFATILVAILITTLLSQIVVQPLKKLVYATHQIARGQFEFKENIQTSDEIGELAESFKTMTHFLQKSHEQITEYSRQLEQKVEERTKRLKQTEQELIRSEKFAAIGQLVAGIAHELNNKLTPILGYTQIFRLLDIEEKYQESVQIIEESASTAKKIVESLLKFSRAQEPTQVLINLNLTMHKTIQLIEPQAKSQNIQLEITLDPELPRILADDGQMNQAFLNILNNAIQSMGQGGTLSILSQHDFKNIFFQIKDTGPGIPENILLKIFDPFFTTKKVGEGTGLGLSITYGIIQAHGGSIHVDSTVHVGTTFIIELPIKK